MAQRKDFTGLDDWYMDTAGYNLDPNFYQQFIRDPREIDQRRFKAYKYYVDWHDGKQWEEQGEWHPAYGHRNFAEEEFNRRTHNVSKNIVDKLVSFLAKEGFAVHLPPELEEAKDVKDTLERVWEANDKEQFCYKMAYMGCIMGDAFIKVSYDEDFYADGVGELKFTVLDSRTVLPFFDEHDRDKMIAARIRYPVYELQESGEKKKRMYTEIHTDANIVYMLDSVVEDVVPNPLGELLIVHIKNEPLPHKRFGRSDYEDLIIVNKEYNEKVSDFSEILAYHAAPVTIAKGVKVQQLERGANKVWGGIPKDGDVYNLTLDTDLASSISYLEMLKKQMHETGNVPEESLGALQNISNTSGAALHIQYQPLMERIEAKYPEYQRGIKLLNRMILRFEEAVGALELPEDLHPAFKYKTIVKWGDPLPRDRSIEVSDIATEMGLMLESRKGALERLGIDNPEQKIEEIDEEQMAMAEMEFMKAGMMGFGDPEAGPGGLAPDGQPMGTSPGAENAGMQGAASQATKTANTNPVSQGAKTSAGQVKKSAQTKTNNQGRPPGS